MGRSEVFFKEVRGSLLMVAALIATVTFSAGIYPPGGFWQDDLQGKHMAGKPIMADKDKSKYDKFMNRNTHAFIQSLLFIMLLLVSYAMPHHTLLVALVFCVGVSLLTTLVFLGLAYSTGSSGLLTESASNDMLHYLLGPLGKTVDDREISRCRSRRCRIQHGGRDGAWSVIDSEEVEAELYLIIPSYATKYISEYTCMYSSFFFFFFFF
ncbi:hypothetical protein QJS04_geneDACA017684 [Acorus gramineus]|uniref:PGG domain-containing protein n=1 Tax=Acorus gramineus TaxID=55184 RepID=A0AAV9BU47_ACOGR|nr:hypothetical protein QJS04_geneDACA017684 [Acorus gramineus]